MRDLNVIPFFGASGGRWEFRVVNTSDNRGTGLGNGGNNLASLLLGVPNVVQVRPLLLNYDYRWKSGAAVCAERLEGETESDAQSWLALLAAVSAREKNNLQGVFPTRHHADHRPSPMRNAGPQLRAWVSPATAPIPSYVPTQCNVPGISLSPVGEDARDI